MKKRSIIADILSLVIIIGGFTCKILGIDGIIDSLLIAIASFYLGSHFKTSNK